MKIPRSVRVLVAPGEVFAEAAASGRGYGAIFAYLGIEFLLVAPILVARNGMIMSFDPVGGFVGLYSAFVNYALGPAVAILACGVGLYYLRRHTTARLDIWNAASTLAYTWVPHTLLVAASALLATAGVDHPVLPHHRFAEVAGGWTLIKIVIEFAPTAAFGWIVLRTTAAPAQSAETAAASPRVARGASGAAVAVTLLLLVAGVARGAFVVDHWELARPVMPTDLAPAFLVRSLDGKQHTTHEDLAGNVTLIDFWATWCGPCVAAMPHLAELHEDLESRGLTLLSVNIEHSNLPSVRQFVADHNLPFTVWVDNGSMVHDYKISTFPTVVLVDRDATVHHIHVGTTSMVTIRSEIEVLLER